MGEISMVNFKSAVFKAVADPSRIRILDFLRSGAKCACEIVSTVGFAQPTVSRHLKLLVDCGILRRRREGNRIFYSVSSPRIYRLLDSVDVELVESLSRNVIEGIKAGYR
ncbi:MAG: metalloregulator ArsR/SmtB family transcription factor [Candidatus Bilamarchaeaceae archaeon]